VSQRTTKNMDYDDLPWSASCHSKISPPCAKHTRHHLRPHSHPVMVSGLSPCSYCLCQSRCGRRLAGTAPLDLETCKMEQKSHLPLLHRPDGTETESPQQIVLSETVETEALPPLPVAILRSSQTQVVRDRQCPLPRVRFCCTRGVL
jgi:hypothetical protein